MFGGVGLVLKGVVFYVVSLIILMIVVVVVVGVFVYVWMIGVQEVWGYINVLIMIGYYVGVLSGQMVGMVELVLCVIGIQYQVVDVFMCIMIIGCVVSEQMVEVLLVVIVMEKVIGQLIDEIIKDFVKFVEELVKVLVKLNE